ncbi:M1 family metallopeptidase [Pseudonocardia hydrocarbonoxydans]|uniref:Aminopeptidase N n=1 Tax=Pseudonocardia hydrocarbonoxydans TaxID=76726 RepID=A0A4Y3WKY5_9PSEU|nr:aminopeptidase [Pseudonocardia hydrocarbonoxydans]
MTDPYLPGHGTADLHVEHYDLELDYRVGSNRLGGRAVLTASCTAPLDRFALDLAGNLAVRRVVVDGRAARFTHRGGKLRVTPARPVHGGCVMEVRYGGNPRPVRGRWGDIGWDELTDGALVASQPVGAPSWFPCNDLVSDKAAYRIAVTAEAPYTVRATGVLTARSRSAGTRTWVFERPEPTATYLAGVQIGRYEELPLGPGQTAFVPPRLRRAATRDLGRHAAMMTALTGLFGPYPFADHQVVVADDDLDVPIEAQGMSVFGANHVDGRRTHERLVLHELAHQWFGNSLTVAAWRHIWLNEGFATYAEWLWSEVSGGRDAASHAREWHAAIAGLRGPFVLADPGPDDLFDLRVYKRGALTLHALRRHTGDAAFFALVRDWATRYRHGSVTTGQFTALAAQHSPTDPAELFTAWLHRPALPPLPR